MKPAEAAPVVGTPEATTACYVTDMDGAVGAEVDPFDVALARLGGRAPCPVCFAVVTWRLGIGGVNMLPLRALPGWRARSGRWVEGFVWSLSPHEGCHVPVVLVAEDPAR